MSSSLSAVVARLRSPVHFFLASGSVGESSTSTLRVYRSRLTYIFTHSTKESVKLQLPRKIDNIVLCPLTDTQKEVYRNIMQLPEVQLLLTADDPCPCGAVDERGVRYKQGKCCEPGWSKLIFKVTRFSDGLRSHRCSRLLLLQYMDLFRKISNHLVLIYPGKLRRDPS